MLYDCYIIEHKTKNRESDTQRLSSISPPSSLSTSMKRQRDRKEESTRGVKNQQKDAIGGRSLVIPCLNIQPVKRHVGCLEHSGLLTVTSAGAPCGVFVLPVKRGLPFSVKKTGPPLNEPLENKGLK